MVREFLDVLRLIISSQGVRRQPGASRKRRIPIHKRQSDNPTREHDGMMVDNARLRPPMDQSGMVGTHNMKIIHHPAMEITGISTATFHESTSGLNGLNPEGYVNFKRGRGVQEEKARRIFSPLSSSVRITND